MSDQSELLGLAGHDSEIGNPRCILDWLAHNARCFSQRPAVEGIERPALTHEGLHEQALEASSALRNGGIGRGDIVLVILPNGPEALTAILSIAAVAVALPIGMNEPMEAIARVLKQSPARAVLYDQTNPGLAEKLCQMYDLQPLPVGVDKQLPAGRFNLQDVQSVQHPANSTYPDDAAILGRTAGTSSEPRIVAWSQASLYRSANAAAEWMELTDQDRSLCLMPFITLHTLVRSCIPGLLRGGSVICTPGFNKNRALDWIKHYRPTYMTAVPGIYRELLIQAKNSPLDTSLRFVASGSDHIDAETVNQLAHVFNVPVREFYGMNEVSPMLAASPPGLMAQSEGATGKALDDWTLEIRDDNGKPLPQGKEGELVARGGLFNPVIGNTARTDDGWYFTGDRGFIDSNSLLHITGRMDERITRGGKKIAPEGVDNVLKSHPSVEQAVAFPIPDNILGERLGALVVPAAGTHPTELELRAFLADQLLDYMVPDHIVFSDTVPLTSLGKLSRRILSAQLNMSPAGNSSSGSTSRISPLSNTEETLLKIVRDLLEQPGINCSDDFMTMGGDSFAATVLLVEIEEKFDILLTPGQFLENSSVEGLSRLIDHPETSQSHPDMETIQVGDCTPPLFFAHGPDGHAIYSRYFISHLGNARTVYALKYIEQHPAPRMEEYAAHFAQLIQTTYPQGPYLIAGHSFGAQLAFEIAQQLLAAGGEVAILALIDDEADLFKRKFGVVNAPAPTRFTFEVCKRMLDCYTPVFYPGDIDLFVSESPPIERLADPSMGWADISTGNVSSFEAKGQHSSMMKEEEIAQWGGIFAERVESALTSWPNRRNNFKNRTTDLTTLRARPHIDATIRARKAGREGNLTAEIEAYTDAIASNAEQPYWVYRNLGDALKQNGDVEKALAALQQGLLREAKPVPGSIHLAHFLRKAGRYREAFNQLDSIESRIEGYSINDGVCALNNLSRAWQVLGYPVQAEHCARRALELKPAEAHSMHLLSQALIQQKQAGEALEVIQKAIVLDPNAPNFFIQLGVVQQTYKDSVAADQAFQRAVELAPRLANPHHQLSKSYNHQGRQKEALLEARKSTELDPTNASFLVYRGILEKKENDLIAAEDSLRKAIELNPNLARARRELGKVYGHQKRSKEALMEFFISARLDVLTRYKRRYAKVLYRIESTGAAFFKGFVRPNREQ